MSEQATETAPEQTEQEQQSGEEPREEQPKQPKPSETVDFWKQKAREQERRAKDNADAAKRLKEIEDAQKSETDKLTERATVAEKRAVDAETALARFQVALEKGLTPSQAKRLVGSSREELEADADELLKDLGDANKPRSPRPDPTQGKQQATPLDPRAADLAQIEADIAAGRRR